MEPEAKFQIGKSGLTEGVLNSIALTLKNRKKVRISVLKSATRDKSELQEMASTIATKLGPKSKFRIIGYTIILRR